MSFVSGLLGGGKGMSYQAVGPSSAQLSQANNTVNNDITQQQSFVNALQGQNGLGNQSSVFGQQQALANQLQGVANGTGPNPAQAALNQATGQNIAAQSALMAGQRGAGANVGLEARQAAMQGANTQQQAAGQGATMQAQQQLAAMQALQGQQANMANLANTQVNQQQTGLTNLNQFGLQNQGNLYGLQQNANSANASIANTAAQGQQNLLGSITGALGSAAQMIPGGAIASGISNMFSSPTDYNSPAIQAQRGFADGGEVKMAQGGQTPSPVSGPQSFAARHMLGTMPTMQPLKQMQPMSQMKMAEGGKVPALVSKGEIRIHKNDVKKVAEGKKSPLDGEKIPGKPKYPGNDYRNDVVPKTLNEGDIIIPNAILQSKNPQWQAHKFVADIISGKHRAKK